MKGRTLPCILLGIATALLCCYCVLITKTLVLSGENEQIFLKVPVWDGTQFSVTFIHSVHKSPLTDYYEIHGKDIYVIKTKYFDFGAGVQTELEDGQKLEYTPDGGLVISGFHQKMNPLIYVVGMVSDHTLKVNQRIYSLRDICGRGAEVIFSVE